MRQRALPLYLCLSVFLWLLSSPSVTAALQRERNLLQASEKSEIIVSKTGDSLAESIAKAKSGDVIKITASRVTLDESVSISVNDLHIQGAAENKLAIIQCTSNKARINVKGDGIVFENVVIRGCPGPAVRLLNENVIEYDPFSLQAKSTPRKKVSPNRMVFRGVHFYENTGTNNGFNVDLVLDGGAIQITEASEALVENCVFEHNAAFLGGAIRVDSGSLTVVSSRFVENEARINGGAISGSYSSHRKKSTTTILVQNSTFLRNRDTMGDKDPSQLSLFNGAPLETSEFLSFPSPQPSGGAIYVEGFHSAMIEESLFDGNTASPAAGAIFVSDNHHVMLTNNTLRNNVARYHDDDPSGVDLEQGGAVYVAFTRADSSIRITNCSFQNNTATYGAGLHMVMMLITRAFIDRCKFIDNVAHLGGGGLVLRNTIEVEILDTKFYRNTAVAGGGAMFTNGAGARFTQGADLKRDSLFEGNTAYDGGACFFLGAGQVFAQQVTFRGNKAQRNGGGMCLVESLASGSVTLQDSTFEENMAHRGGGLFMDSISSLIIRSSDQIKSTRFINNKAMAGGAVYLRPSSQVKNVVLANHVHWVGNRAVTRLEEIYPTPLFVERDIVRNRGYIGARRLLENYFQDKANGINESLIATDDDPCSPGGGGAVCLVLSEVPERASVSVEVMNSYIADNFAATGGGVFIATKKKSVWTASCRLEGTASESLIVSPCRRLSIRDVTLENNAANHAGGAIFATDASQVHYSSVATTLGDDSFQRLSVLGNSEIGSTNTVGRGGYGAQYASNAAALKIISPVNVPGEDGDNLLVKNHASGTLLPVIKLRLVDSFGNTVSSGITDSKLKVTASSGVGIVSGQLVAEADHGVVIFDSLVVTADPGTYNLFFQAEEKLVKSYVVWLSVRHCKIGEHNIVEGKICSECQSGFYGFDPDIPCQACEREANCTGGALQTPRNGYWHSTPFSPQFHECLVPRACSYQGRDTRLIAFVNNSDIVPGTDVYSNAEYPQCNTGYGDVLCGSCSPNYGSKPGGECIECRGRLATYSIVSIVALWQLVLLGLTIRSALNSIRDMRDMRAIIARNNGGNAAALPNTYQIKLTSTPSASSLAGSSKKIALSASGAEFSQSFSSRRSDTVSGVGTPSNKNLTPIDHIIAAETVSETIKIAVNFLQVTSVAVSINVEWTETVKRMLETENSAAGFSNGSAFAPLTCLLESSKNRSINGLILRVAFPVTIIMFVIFMFVLNWIRIRESQQKGLEYIHSRSVICILVGLFFSYESLNRELMRVVNCVQLDSEDLEDETGYSEYSVARGQYWGEDTSFKCFEDTHLRLFTIMGIPGLALFSVGIPAFLLVFLLYNREKQRINEQDFLNTYGFVYQNYTERFIYWEVSIMLRKACIGGIVVFAYPLGANLQGIMALGVLIVALVLHLVATPFKYRILNVLESFSLIVSIFTFYSGIVFNDSNTSYPAKVLLSILLLMINSSLFLMFIVRVLMDVDRFITAKLILLGEVEIPDKFMNRWLKLASVLLEKAKEQVHNTIQTQASRFVRSRTFGDRPPAHALSGIQEADLEMVHSTASILDASTSAPNG